MVKLKFFKNYVIFKKNAKNQVMNGVFELRIYGNLRNFKKILIKIDI